MSSDDPGVTVPDEPAGGTPTRRPVAAAIGGLALLAGLIALVALVQWGAGNDEEVAVRRSVAALVEAASRGDGEVFLSHVHLRRLAAQSVQLGVLSKEVAEGSLETLGSRLAGSCVRAAGTERQWRTIRITNVSLQADGAEVFGRVRTGMGQNRFRFWLIREEESWKVFDWESMDDALRISAFLPALFPDKQFRGADTGEMRGIVELVRGAMMYGAAGDHQKALEILENVRSLPASEPLWQDIDRLEAEFLLAKGDPKEALRATDRGVGRAEVAPMLLLFRAESLSERGRHEESIAAARAFLDRVGEDAEALNLVGLALQELGKDEEAADAWRKGIAADPEDYMNRLSLGVDLLRRGGVEEAADFLIEACRYAPAALGYFESAAPELAAERAYGPLLELAEDQAGRTPSDTQVGFYRGFALRRLGRLEEAESTLRAALRENDQGNRLGLRSELALALIQSGRGEEGHELAERMEAEDPVWGDYLHACLAAHGGRRDEALRSLRFVLRADPSYHRDVEWEPVLEKLARQPEVRSLLRAVADKAAYGEEVDAAMKREAWNEVLAASEERAKVAPDDADAFYYQGMALRRLERYEAAHKAFEEGAGKVGEKDRSAFWRELAFVLAHLGSFADAHAHADRLIGTDRMGAPGYHARAYVFALEGKEDRAVEAVKSLLRRHPTWRAMIEDEAVFEKLRKRPDVKELLKEDDP